MSVSYEKLKHSCMTMLAVEFYLTFVDKIYAQIQKLSESPQLQSAPRLQISVWAKDIKY